MPCASALSNELTIAAMVRALDAIPLDEKHARALAYCHAGFSNRDILRFDDEAVRIARLKLDAMRRGREQAA